MTDSRERRGRRVASEGGVGLRVAGRVEVSRESVETARIYEF